MRMISFSIPTYPKYLTKMGHHPNNLSSLGWASNPVHLSFLKILRMGAALSGRAWAWQKQQTKGKAHLSSLLSPPYISPRQGQNWGNLL